jgi:hypothetical protein
MNEYWRLPIVIHKVGRSHLMTGQPCQDAYFLNTSKNKQWIVAVVCDGAGSAERSLEGAKLASTAMGTALLRIADTLDKKSPGHWINDEIIQSIIDVRKSLRNIAESDSIAAFHTTIVAVLLGPSGGVSVHIGDGAIFGANLTNQEDKTFIDSDYRISLPENGEYANETFFLTEADWIKHLRINALPSLDWFAIGSDGGCSLALIKESELREQFFMQLFTRVLIEDVEIEEIEDNLNETKEFDKLTSDDITLITVISNKNFNAENIAISKKVTPPLSERPKEPQPDYEFLTRIKELLTLLQKKPIILALLALLIFWLMFLVYTLIQSKTDHQTTIEIRSIKEPRSIKEVIESTENSNDQKIESKNNPLKPKQDH